MSWLLILAAEASAQPVVDDSMPFWLKAVLGPLGALILLGFYAYRTETVRMPMLSGFLEEARAELKTEQIACEKAKASLRTAYEAREKALLHRLQCWMERHSRERTRRVFWQTSATDIARRNKEEAPKLPRDLGATSYNHQPLPRDPEPDNFRDDAELPPIPD